jgi:hypothetical protein
MIKIDFREPSTPEWIRWRNDCAAAQATLDTAKARGESVPISSNLYGRMKEAVYLAVEGPFHGKCAYCEERIRTAQHGDMEHFRPKAALKDQHDRPVLLANGEEHPGYYWLAYDWKNLLPSCQLCNQPSTARSDDRIGKWNFFPLADETQRAPGEEVREEPLLINPVEDDPVTDLRLDASGVFSARNGSTRGQTCIEVLGLNDRGLPGERAKVYANVQRLFISYATELIQQKNLSFVAELKAQLDAIEQGRDAFTAAARLSLEDARRNLGPVIGQVL